MDTFIKWSVKTCTHNRLNRELCLSLIATTSCFLMQTEKMLSAWMLWFQRRHKQYEDWAEEGEPKVMWLSGIQIPETYIAALVQTACRDKGWPLDRSTTYTQVNYQFVCY
jgi:hypothetical protein